MVAQARRRWSGGTRQIYSHIEWGSAYTVFVQFRVQAKSQDRGKITGKQ